MSDVLLDVSLTEYNDEPRFLSHFRDLDSGHNRTQAHPQDCSHCWDQSQVSTSWYRHIVYIRLYLVAIIIL